MWLDCKHILEIKGYNVFYTGNYNSKLRKIKQGLVRINL